MYPNVAFQNFGFDKVTNVSRVNIVSEITDTTNTVSADFTFILDGTPYSGPGTWESIETDTSLDITLDYSLSNGGNVLEFHYTSTGDFINDIKDETVNASLGSSTLSIVKHTEETITPTSETTNITGVVELNNEEFNASITIVEDIISQEISQFTITSQNTPVNPSGPVTTVFAEYQTATDQDGSTATFTTYDVTIGETLTYTLDPGKTSIHQVLKADENSATESLVMNLLHVTDGNKKIKYQVENPLQINSISKLNGARNGSGWSWNDFSKETFKGAVVCGTGGAVAAFFATDGGAPVSVPTVALAAAAGGAVGGAVGYTVDKLWDWIYQGSSTPANAETVTYAENDSMNVGQNTQGGSSYPIPTLSEWKQIFLALVMLSLVMGFMRKTHPKAALSYGGTMLRITDSNFLAFNRHIYTSALKWVGVVVVFGLAGVAVVADHLKIVDLLGTLFCAPLVAYILHLMISFVHDSQGISGLR